MGAEAAAGIGHPGEASTRPELSQDGLPVARRAAVQLAAQGFHPEHTVAPFRHELLHAERCPLPDSRQA
eukprot:scaffold25383_cov35-Prasinocladus_malaysianus.AAC.1